MATAEPSWRIVRVARSIAATLHLRADLSSQWQRSGSVIALPSSIGRSPLHTTQRGVRSPRGSFTCCLSGGRASRPTKSATRFLPPVRGIRHATQALSIRAQRRLDPPDRVRGAEERKSSVFISDRGYSPRASGDWRPSQTATRALMVAAMFVGLAQMALGLGNSEARRQFRQGDVSFTPCYLPRRQPRLLAAWPLRRPLGYRRPLSLDLGRRRPALTDHGRLERREGGPFPRPRQIVPRPCAVFCLNACQPPFSVVEWRRYQLLRSNLSCRTHPQSRRLPHGWFPIRDALALADRYSFAT